MNSYQNYIGGGDVPAADGRTFTAFNPATGAPWGTFAVAGTEDVDRAVKAASAAFRDGPWGALSPTRRGRLLMKWGGTIAEHADRIATIETGQNGKLFAEMRAQARIAQDWLYYFGGLSRVGWVRWVGWVRSGGSGGSGGSSGSGESRRSGTWRPALAGPSL